MKELNLDSYIAISTQKQHLIAILLEVLCKWLSIAINTYTNICQKHKIELILLLYLMWLDTSNTKAVKCMLQVMQYRISVGEIEMMATAQIGVVEKRGCELPKRREQMLAELGEKCFQ